MYLFIFAQITEAVHASKKPSVLVHVNGAP